jgi:hypothetical protein
MRDDVGRGPETGDVEESTITSAGILIATYEPA